MRDTFAVMRMTKLSFNLLPKGVSSASKQSQEMATNEEANREGRLFTPQPNNPVPRCQKTAGQLTRERVSTAKGFRLYQPINRE